MSTTLRAPSRPLAGTMSLPGEDPRFAITVDDAPWWQDVKDLAEQQRIRDLLDCFAAMLTAKSINKAAEQLAQRHRGRRGFSAKTLKDQFRTFRQSGWNKRSLVRAWSNGKTGLPPAFVKFIQELDGQTRGREDSWAATWRRFLEDYWAGGAEVPGYGTWQQWWCRQHPSLPLPARCPLAQIDLPEGWSADNIGKHYLPDRATRSMLKFGIATSRRDHKVLRRSRRDLRPLELVTIDDFWADQYYYSVTEGASKPFRAVGLLALDVATTLAPILFMKGRTEDEFGKKQAIRKGDMQELLLHLLREGLPPYPMHLLVENASAAISPEVQLCLEAAFGERLVILRTGMYHELMLQHGFRHKGGKPHEKGWIESHICQLHRAANHLQAQTGPRYDRQPDDLNALVKYTEQLLSDPLFTAEDKAQLRLPMMRLEQAQRIYRTLLNRLENRTDHRLEGFEQLVEWRTCPSQPWQPEAALATVSRDLVPQLELNKRMEKPVERWQRLCPPRADFLQPAPSQLWYLYPKSREARIQRGGITFSDKALGPQPVEFWSEQTSHALRQHEGEKVMVYYDREADHLCLTTRAPKLSERRFLGVLPRDGRPGILDGEAVGKAMGAIARDREATLTTARAITAEADQRLKRDKQFNEYLREQAQERQMESGPAPRRLSPTKQAQAEERERQDAQRTRWAEEAERTREEDLDLSTF